jgi:hypothetical protein
MNLSTIWLNYVETPLDKVGLLESPLKRFGAFTVGTMGLLYITKPRTLFDAQGKPFPSTLLSNEPKSVPVNWIATSIFVGVLSILFI